MVRVGRGLRRPARQARDRLVDQCQQLVKPRPDLGLGNRAGELTDDPATDDRLDRGDPLDAGGLGKLRVRVHIDLREHPAPAVGLGQPLEYGAELLARAAPRRPEIDHHRGLQRPLQDLGLERRLGDVQDDGLPRGPGAGRAGPGARGARRGSRRRGFGVERDRAGKAETGELAGKPWIPGRCVSRPRRY